MSNQLILMEEVSGIATVTLNRPEKRNAMNQELMLALAQTLTRVRDSSTIRVLVLRGQGENFCAGGDIQTMQDMVVAPYADNLHDATILADLILQLYQLPQPTIALAHGATRGGGLGLLAACDIVIAAKTANFGFSEVKIGIAPSIVSPYVIAAIGARAAQYYFLTGDNFSSDEAYRIGLVQQIVEPESLLSSGNILAKKLILNSPAAMTAAKQLIRQVSHESITPELAKKTADNLAQLRASPDGIEGLRAFLEKRQPVWR